MPDITELRKEMDYLEADRDDLATSVQELETKLAAADHIALAAGMRGAQNVTGLGFCMAIWWGHSIGETEAIDTDAFS